MRKQIKNFRLNVRLLMNCVRRAKTQNSSENKS